MLIIFILIVFSYKSKLSSISEKKRKKYKKDNSIEELNKRIWFKNYDLIKDKKNTFDLPGPYQTLYGFSKCDIIINKDSFMIVGKTDAYLFLLNLNPTIFWYSKINKGSRNVSVKNIRELKNGLEIEFEDEKYSKFLTFRIRDLSKSAKEKIKTGYNKAQNVDS